MMDRRQFGRLGLAALAAMPKESRAASGVIETQLAVDPRAGGPLGKTFAKAWPVYQRQVRIGVVANDLMALTGRNLNGQDRLTTRVYQDLWLQLSPILTAAGPEEAGVECVTIHVQGTGGRLMPREVTPQDEIPLPIWGMTWGATDPKVVHGLVAFKRAGIYLAFAKRLVIRAKRGDGDGVERALRLLTWLDCGNSSITLPPSVVVETVVPPAVVINPPPTVPAKADPGQVWVTLPGEERPLPIPPPTSVTVRLEYQDEIRCVAPPAPPVQPARLETVVLADSRRQLRGPGQQLASPGQLTVGHQSAITAGVTWWSWPKSAPSGGGNSCPAPTVKPDPSGLPGDPPAPSSPPVDTTLPPNPGGAPPVAGADGAVNTPGASDPSTFPAGSVVIPIPAPGSAAAAAASLPG